MNRTRKPYPDRVKKRERPKGPLWADRATVGPKRLDSSGKKGAEGSVLNQAGKKTN